MLLQMKPAIDHHQQNNSHHPEFFGVKGISGMDLVQLVEMFGDWKAATLRHNDGNIFKSIEINRDRFKIQPELIEIFKNTALNFGW
jgi:hypothetical protein